MNKEFRYQLESKPLLPRRRVTLFPDSGCYEKWSGQMSLTQGIDYNVSDRLEQMCRTGWSNTRPTPTSATCS